MRESGLRLETWPDSFFLNAISKTIRNMNLGRKLISMVFLAAAVTGLTQAQELPHYTGETLNNPDYHHGQLVITSYSIHYTKLYDHIGSNDGRSGRYWPWDCGKSFRWCYCFWEMQPDFGGDYKSYISESGKTLPSIVVAINNFAAFIETRNNFV